ncbi:MAG: YjbQ family protein, partial [Candidatus Zixiibacteriota bacterium]
PDVTRDIIHKLNKEIPQNEGYHHSEGNSDAHIKSSLVGCSQQILIENGNLVLGHWQAVYFCEFDGPRQRRLIVKVGALA